MRAENVRPSRILLYGPSGCGKTIFASACFNEAKKSNSSWVTVKIVASEILEDPTTNLKEAFDALKSYNVRGLFIEDIDYLFSDLRSNLASYQLFLEKMRDENGIQLTIATTRNPETLAIRELEVFNDILPILYPNEKERLDILRVHTRGIKLETSVNLKIVAQNTQWWSGDEIREMIRRSSSANNLLTSDALSQSIQVISEGIDVDKRVERMQEFLIFTKKRCNNKKIRNELLSYYEPLIDNHRYQMGTKGEARHAEQDSLLVHPNIEILTNRMNDALKRGDYPGVLHASASIFETLAKDIVGIPTVQNKTLKMFFDRYRNDSTLPNEILDYILAVYVSRNITPLAGHGSTEIPTVSRKTATTLCEMTKAFVNIEYRLRGRKS